MNQINPDLMSDPGFIVILSIAVIMLGPCLGSFASAIAYRAPRRISWITDQGKGARSACPHCGYVLRFFDLIPILSWVLLKGRCRNCHAPVSGLYPALEISALIVSLLLFKTFGAGLLLVTALAALPFVLALIVITWQGYVLPRQLLIILAMLGVTFTGVRLSNAGGYGDLVIAEFCGGLLVFFVFGFVVSWVRKKMAKSDTSSNEAPFLAICGLWLGVHLLPAFLIVAGVVGVILTMARVWLKMPRIHIMGPAYIIAFIAVLIAGQQIMAQLIP